MAKGKKKAKKVSENTENEAPKVPFATWFHYRLMEGKVNKWQEKELSVFFKFKGLSDQEQIEIFDRFFELY